MNIKRAKQEIANTVRAYLCRDEDGEYAIPSIRQRPILLMGPPGIGKTQIMEQVAREQGVALVAYTITHHTRQSAVGLPMIQQRQYGGKPRLRHRIYHERDHRQRVPAYGGHRPFSGHSVH